MPFRYIKIFLNWFGRLEMCFCKRIYSSIRLGLFIPRHNPSGFRLYLFDGHGNPGTLGFRCWQLSANRSLPKPNANSNCYNLPTHLFISLILWNLVQLNGIINLSILPCCSVYYHKLLRCFLFCASTFINLGSDLYRQAICQPSTNSNCIGCAPIFSSVFSSDTWYENAGNCNINKCPFFY